MVGLKIALLLVKNACFGVKRGMSELSHWVAAKHTTLCMFINYKLFLTNGAFHAAHMVHFAN